MGLMAEIQVRLVHEDGLQREYPTTEELDGVAGATCLNLILVKAVSETFEIIRGFT